MAFIQVTRHSDGKPIHIRDSAVIAVAEKGGKTNIFVVGDLIPFEVKESVDTVLDWLRD